MSLNSHALKLTYFLQTEATIQTLAPEPELPKESMVLKMIMRSFKRGVGEAGYIWLPRLPMINPILTAEVGILHVVYMAWSLGLGTSRYSYMGRFRHGVSRVGS